TPSDMVSMKASLLDYHKPTTLTPSLALTEVLLGEESSRDLVKFLRPHLPLLVIFQLKRSKKPLPELPSLGQFKIILAVPAEGLDVDVSSRPQRRRKVRQQIQHREMNAYYRLDRRRRERPAPGGKVGADDMNLSREGGSG